MRTICDSNKLIKSSLLDDLESRNPVWFPALLHHLSTDWPTQVISSPDGMNTPVIGSQHQRVQGELEIGQV